MGLKSGSRDAGLDDSEDKAEDQDSDEPGDVGAGETPEGEESPDAGVSAKATGDDATPSADGDSASGSTDTGQKSGGDRPTMSSIPYKLRRERVNEGREQVPYFLREEVIDAEDDLQGTLEDILGEDVYKSDYREAAMIVAQRNPELVAEILREWGYDLDM